MKFFKFRDITTEISDLNNTIKFEIFVGESENSWMWFNAEIYLEFKALLEPVIKKLYENQNKYFYCEYDSSPIEFLAGSSFQVAYFFKKDPYSLNPCLIKCKQENRYKEICVSSIKLISSVCKYVSDITIDAQQTVLLNKLKRYLGKVVSEPITISSYFQKEKVKNQLKSQTDLGKNRLDFKKLSVNEKSEEKEDQDKFGLISASYPIVGIKEEIIEEFSDDCDFELSNHFNMAPKTKKLSKKKETSPNATLLTYWPKNTNKVNCNIRDTSRNDSSIDCDNVVDNIENVENKRQETCYVDENLCANNEDEKVDEKTSKYFCSNNRKFDIAELHRDVDKYKILSELEKPDPTLDILIAESKLMENCKNKIIAPIFNQPPNWLSKDDSFDVMLSKKRCKKLKKPSVAKKRRSGKKIGNLKSNVTVKRKNPFEQTKTITAMSDSDDDLPPAFDIDNSYQPSREELFENLTQSRNLNMENNNKAHSDCSNKSSSPKEDFVIEETGPTSKIQNLTEERLELLMNENNSYFKDIYRGKIYSRRHQEYVKGGKARRDLISQVFLSYFEDSQVDFVMEKLLDIFCTKNQKLNDYSFKVMLTEALIKIVMDYENLNYEDAEKTIFLARFT